MTSKYLIEIWLVTFNYIFYGKFCVLFKHLFDINKTPTVYLLNGGTCYDVFTEAYNFSWKIFKQNLGLYHPAVSTNT